MPSNEEDYLNKLLETVNANQMAKKEASMGAPLSKEELEIEQLSNEVKAAMNKAGDEIDVIDSGLDEGDLASDLESLNSLEGGELNNESKELDMDADVSNELDFDADLSEDSESASLIDALGDILDGYENVNFDDDIEIDNEINPAINIDEELDLTSGDTTDNAESDDINLVEDQLADESNKEEGSETEDEPNGESNGESDGELASSIDDLMNEKEEISEDESLNPEDVASAAIDEDEVDEESKEAKADEEIDKMLEDTDLSAEDVNISVDDIDEDLSENEIDRLVNMDLDNIIEDAKDESVSLDDIFEDAKDVEDNNDDLDNKKNKKKKGKKKDKNEGENLLEDINEKKEKGGFFAKLRDIFFESIEEEDLEEDKSIKKGGKRKLDENGKILQEIDDETADDSAKKKGFFAKFKYRIDQWKKKQAEEEAKEEEQEAIEAEEAKKLKEEKKAAAKEAKEAKAKEAKEKPKKEKKEKPKKEPKPKKPKKEKPEPQPGDILKIKPVSMILFILFVSGVIVLLLVLIKAVNYDYSSNNAKNYFAKGDFFTAYKELDGLSLNETDKTIYEQAKTILYVQSQYRAYNSYLEMDNKTDALNSLIKGVIAYDKYIDDAKSLGVYEEFDEAYKEILNALEETFSIDEKKAKSLVDMYNSDFTKYYFVIMDYGEAAGNE
ncbi:hypothetical protein [Lachnospira multipara]|uniref:hypothetical protein n=1 Tax=Lachnospira multipara TaxID=28051 RepID=UPI0005582666|nr:hypothetical protein [Lachnospira multipara]